MADTKITGLTALTAPVNSDLAVLVDVSDTTMDAAGTNKKILLADLFGAIMPWSIIPSTGEYLIWPNGSNASGQDTTVGIMYYCPLWVPKALTADRIAVKVDASGSAGAVLRLGIYTASPTTRKPDALVLDAGTVDGTSTGQKEITISQALTAGLYWLASVPQVATCGPRCFDYNSLVGPRALYTTALAVDTPTQFVYRESSVTGALPSSATPVVNNTGSNRTPILGLRVA